MSRKPGRKPADTRPEPAFGALVGGVRPVRARPRVKLEPPPPAPRARFRRADERAVLDESLHGDGPALEVGEELNFRRPQIPARVLKDLRRGRYSIQDELDLHGLTATDARRLLLEFMQDAIASGRRCVRIIHGKGLRSGPGGPVLKSKLNRWLPQWDEVLAFTTAPARDGGTGALYVLLRG